MLGLDVINQMDLAGIYRALHPNTEGFTFFLAHQEMSSAMNHILRYEANLSRYMKTELPSGILTTMDESWISATRDIKSVQTHRN